VPVTLCIRLLHVLMIFLDPPRIKAVIYATDKKINEGCSPYTVYPFGSNI
jgi:hypothetical protein